MSVDVRGRDVAKRADPGPRSREQLASARVLPIQHDVFVTARDGELAVVGIADQRERGVLVALQPLAYVFVEHFVDHRQ